MTQVPDARRVAVIIPTWNRLESLQECVASVGALDAPPDEVIVVDNGSSDGTSRWLELEHPDIVLLRHTKNLGFAAAVNAGIQSTQADWIAVLNNDAVPEPSWLSAMLALAETDPATGSVASRMMFLNDRERVSSLGIRMDVSGAAWDLGIGETTWPQRSVEVFGASAGACLYRREMLQDVGLFEESFFAYLEDADLAWRARLRGWKTVLAPDALVYHALSSTAGEGSPFKRFHLARNKWQTIIRTYPLPQLLEHLPVMLLYDALSVLNSLVTGDRASLRGRLAALQRLPALLAQRRAIQARRTASWPELQAALSPLESPLTLRRRSKLVGKLAGKRTGSALGQPAPRQAGP